MGGLPLNYCIDSTEVTQSQYQAWLNTTTAATISNQISVCSSWNTTFTPDSSCMSSSSACTSSDCPQVCVDWCDAYAYCAGVGKRLCGKIGGGSNEYNDYADVTKSQWYAACTSNGTYSSTGYPYGNTYQATYCNGYDANKSSMVAVGTMSQCQSTVSGYTGVYDLSGNVYEWEDSCVGTAGSSDNCVLRGGAFDATIDSLQCGIAAGPTRSNVFPAFGFRCCSP